VEKNLSLTSDEASALLEMAVCSYADTDSSASTSAILKLRELFGEFAEEERRVPRTLDHSKLRRAA
jgi:hypothetical protein